MRKLVVMAALSVAGVAEAADARQMVDLPPVMQEHMLANMRDHLAAIDDILSALAGGRSKEAADIAERRLGMTSLAAHGAEHMAPFMPADMRSLGTSLHQAASRFAIAALDAELEPDGVGSRRVFDALQDVTAACRGCHDGYRIR